MPNSLDCIFWIRKAPTFVFKDGAFHLCFDVGKQATIELAMSPSTFLKMRRESGRAADAFHEGKRNVVGFADRSKADSGQPH